MHFDEAIDLVKSGIKVRREGWINNSYIYFDIKTKKIMFFRIEKICGEIISSKFEYTPCHSDVIKDDWIVLD